MLSAALWSRSKTKPQRGHRCVRSESDFKTGIPQREQSWLVHCGGTPAYPNR